MYKKIYLILILKIIFFSQFSIAQEIPNTLTTDNESSFSNAWDNFKTTSSSAFSIKKYEAWQVLLFGGLTAHFVFGNDIELHEDYVVKKEGQKLGIPRVLGNIGDTYDKPGPIYATLGLAGVMYGTGKIINDKKLVETTQLMTQSLIITAVFTTALKVLIGRARPYAKAGPHSYRPFNFSFDSRYMSMPSGHTSSAFALMTVIAKQYDLWYVNIPAYTFGVSVAVQRMNDNKHWGSDLIIGGTIGYLIGSAVVNRNNKQKSGYTLQPLISSNGIGFAVEF